VTPMPADTILQELLELSRDLGRVERRLVILGEGNTSADCGDGTFWVKASGSQLATIEASGFARVAAAPLMGLLDAGPIDDDQVIESLRRAAVGTRAQPSIETFLHAVCLTDGGARVVAHTHPVAVNSLLCSRLGAEPFLQHIFPDAVVVCGRAPVVVPYADPGMPLARAARDALRRHRQQFGGRPKMMLLLNHGLVALGQTAREALNITLMADKWAGILLGTYALGGPRPLLDREVERIDRRPDEEYRRRRLAGKE